MSGFLTQESQSIWYNLLALIKSLGLVFLSMDGRFQFNGMIWGPLCKAFFIVQIQWFEHNWLFQLDWMISTPNSTATVWKQFDVANSGVALIFSVARSLLWHWVCCIKMCGSERVRPARFGRCPGIARRPHRASWPSTTYHNQAQPSLPNKAGSWPHAYNLLEHATLLLTNT